MIMQEQEETMPRYVLEVRKYSYFNFFHLKYLKNPIIRTYELYAYEKPFCLTWYMIIISTFSMVGNHSQSEQ